MQTLDNPGTAVMPAPITGVMTIRGVNIPTNGAMSGTLTFEEHPGKSIRFWLSAGFKDKLEKGASAQAVIETRPNKNPSYQPEMWLASWDGVADRREKSGKTYSPPPEHPTLGAMAGVAMSVAVQYNAATLGKVMEDADAIFNRMIAMVQRGKGRIS